MGEDASLTVSIIALAFTVVLAIVSGWRWNHEYEKILTEVKIYKAWKDESSFEASMLYSKINNEIFLLCGTRRKVVDIILSVCWALAVALLGVLRIAADDYALGICLVIVGIGYGTWKVATAKQVMKRFAEETYDGLRKWKDRESEQ